MSNYDVIIIGSGAGGGALALKLAPSGKRILHFGTRRFSAARKRELGYQGGFSGEPLSTDEVWQDSEGKPLHPQTAYWVGGNTKVYGAALFRLRRT